MKEKSHSLDHRIVSCQVGKALRYVLALVVGICQDFYYMIRCLHRTLYDRVAFADDLAQDCKFVPLRFEKILNNCEIGDGEA